MPVSTKNRIIVDKPSRLPQKLSKNDLNTLLGTVITPKYGHIKHTSIESGAVVRESELDKSIKSELSELSIDTVAFLCAPLLLTESKKIVSNSFLKDKHGLYPAVIYAGLQGMKKGMYKYDPNTGKGKSIHYIIRWFSTYAKRELEKTEGNALGIVASRVVVFKKIAAIRLKMENDLGYTPSDEQVLDYIHSGQADMGGENTARTVGREKKTSVKANSKITIEDIREQRVAYSAYFSDSHDSAMT